MKTNVSIKSNYIEEYREIEKKLIELRCTFTDYIDINEKYVYIDYVKRISTSVIYWGDIYNSLEEFLKDYGMINKKQSGV